MAIDKLPPGLTGGAQAVGGNKYKASTQADNGQTPASPQVKQDSVSLTPEAQRLNKMQQSLASAPVPDNSARLEALKKAVNEGSYQIDSDRLAANIANLEQDIETL